MQGLSSLYHILSGPVWLSSLFRFEVSESWGMVWCSVYAFQVSSAHGILHDFRAAGPGHGQACFYGYYGLGISCLILWTTSELLAGSGHCLVLGDGWCLIITFPPGRRTWTGDWWPLVVAGPGGWLAVVWWDTPIHAATSGVRVLVTTGRVTS